MSLKITDKVIHETHLRAVLELVCGMSDDPDVQLSILNLALLVGAKTVGVPKAVLLRQLESAWDYTHPLAVGRVLKPDAKFIGLPPVGRD